MIFSLSVAKFVSKIRDELKESIWTDSTGKAISLVWKNLDDLQELRRIPPLSGYPIKEFVDRKDALEKFAKYMEDRDLVKPMPFAVAAAAPGGGKSRFLNFAAETTSNYFPVAVTFNTFSNNRLPSEGHYWALSKRVLFSYALLLVCEMGPRVAIIDN